MRVLLFTENEYVTGGTTTFVKMLAANRLLFDKKGVELKFATIKGNPAGKEYPDDVDFLKVTKTQTYNDKRDRCLDKRNKCRYKLCRRLIRISNKILWRIRRPCMIVSNKRELRKYLLENQFDCVIANSGGFCSNIGIQMLQEAEKIKVSERIFLSHNYPTMKKRNIREKIQKKSFESQVYCFVTRILTVSEYCACQIRVFLEQEVPVEVIYNGMGKKETKLVKMDKVRFLIGNREMGENTFILGMIANFMPYKGTMYFLEVIRKLRMQGRNVIGIIIGNDYDKAYYTECLNYILHNQMSDYIVIRQGLTNASDYVEAYDVLCMPSVETESFGLVALEAASYCVPTVGFRTGGIPEVVENGKSGYVVQVGNTDAMANAICNLLDDKQLYEDFCVHSFERWKTLFSDRVMCENYVKYLKKLL